MKRLIVMKNYKRSLSRDSIVNDCDLNGEELTFPINTKKWCILWDNRVKRSYAFTNDDIYGLIHSKIFHEHGN